jgi:hypothetical protein
MGRLVNLKKDKHMTDEEINITIAESWGIPPEDAYDYCNDTQAMLEIEERIMRDSKENYMLQLRYVVGMIGPYGGRKKLSNWGYFTLGASTPRQRAEAYLKYKMKWKE